MTNFAVLGPLAVRQNGHEVRVTAPMARLLLATLLLHSGEVISVAKLVDTLWNQDPPPTARTALHNHVMRLRRVLGADLGQRIRSHPCGYSITVRDGELDLHRFSQQYELGMTAARQGAWERAADRLRTALAEWTGEPLADLRWSALDAAELPWLAELRLQALEHRIVADHRLGRHEDTIPELRYLCGVYPLRERLRELLMSALLQRGGHAEAFEVYTSTRKVLVAELGVEPGPAIQRLRERLVAREWSGGATGAPPGLNECHRSALSERDARAPAVEAVLRAIGHPAWRAAEAWLTSITTAGACFGGGQDSLKQGITQPGHSCSHLSPPLGVELWSLRMSRRPWRAGGAGGGAPRGRHRRAR